MQTVNIRRIAGKVNFQIRDITRDKGAHFMIKSTIDEADMTIMNVHVLNNRDSKERKQKLTELKGQIENPTIIVRDF